MTIAAFAGGGSADPAPAPAATPARAAGDRGAAVFAEQGCGSCHTFAPANARGGLGPDLALSLNGKSTAFIEQSILLPDEVVAYGWSPGMMPDDFARRIAPTDLGPLVAYLFKGAEN
jgi:hypothetical protein